ncbi:MAG: triosephosphate isomerase (TIM) [Parcubacteria group bacterium Gr01-1014_19]|nr:MAG: triosephosphate isomerase (TIM) [Parcubacteria group bacterium Gr01-1014_19]
MSKIIIANWKLNPSAPVDAEKLAKESDVKGLVIAPPFPFLEFVEAIIKKADLGAQDLFWEDSGAYTGEVSGAQLKSLKVSHVIIGHSERRLNLGETDEMVAKKVAVALKDGLMPVVCVGETRQQRDKNQTAAVVEQEVRIGLSRAGAGSEVVVAYEPIWAIGTGSPDTPENMLKMVKLIKEVAGRLNVKVRCIYGGSVKADNADTFLSHPEIEGALVGGASLKPEEIKKIVSIANKYA